MVVGNGLLAKAFNAYSEDDSLVIFASGVSNSLELSEEEFGREQMLLQKTIKSNPEKLLVYFSTCSIYDQTVKDRPYTQHKIKMEEFIKNESSNYLICRLSNIVGRGGNENTIFNYLINTIKSGSKLNLWKNATRNILGVDDMVKIVGELVNNNTKNTTINVANLNSYTMESIVNRIENFLSKKADVVLLDKGEPVIIDISSTKDVLLYLKNDFSVNYVDSLLLKYFK